MNKSTLLLFLLSIQLLAQMPVKINRDNGSWPYNEQLKPFYHGVASGDPLHDRVIIWTRVTPDTDQVITGSWTVASDTGFTSVTATGTFTTDISSDYTVKIDVTGLQSNTTYYYRFQVLDTKSITGRTKTTPSPSATVNHLRFAVTSCANYEGGLFNAYKSIAKRNDLDAIIHLGDYIYEYKPGGYKNKAHTPPNPLMPEHEIITEADYRTRYALYRLDPNLCYAHQQHPFISIWDDHESANDSYVDGAQNHDPNTEGSWTERKNISKKVYFEWMPIRDNDDKKIYRKISYGSLADLFLLDTRLEGRDKPPIHFDTPDDPQRRIISDEQFDWLCSNVKASDAKWKVIGNQVLFSTFNVGFMAGYKDGQRDISNIDSIRDVEDQFDDNWESYPTQRNQVIDAFKNNNLKNVLFITGDSHCSWAFDVTKQAVIYPDPSTNYIPKPNLYNSSTGEGYSPGNGNGSYAVELGTPSVSSQNFDERTSAQLASQVQYAMNNPIPTDSGNVNYNPHLKYVELTKHGYFVLDLKTENAQADFYYQSSILSPQSNESFGRGVLVKDQFTKVFNSNTSQQAIGKNTQDIPAPSPFAVNSNTTTASSVISTQNLGVLFLLYPNPAKDRILLNFSLLKNTEIEIIVSNIYGQKVAQLLAPTYCLSGVHQVEYYLGNINDGTYILSINSKQGNLIRKLYIQK